MSSLVFDTTALQRVVFGGEQHRLPRAIFEAYIIRCAPSSLVIDHARRCNPGSAFNLKPLMAMRAVHRTDAPPGPAGHWLIDHLKGTSRARRTIDRTLSRCFATAFWLLRGCAASAPDCTHYPTACGSSEGSARLGSEPLNPRPKLYLPCPCAAWLSKDVEVGVCNRIGGEHRVRLVGVLGPAGGAEPAVAP